MIVRQDLRDALRFACDLLKHCELIARHRDVFVDSGFNVPACEVATVGARECARAESANRRALPITVVDVGFVLANAGIVERFAERTSPGDLRDFVAAERLWRERSEE